MFIRLAVETQAIEKFAKVFNFDFFRFRAEMKDIARASLRAVTGARISYGFDEFQSWFRDPEDELIFPIDDDDLFHPGLASLAEKVERRAQVVVWPYAAFGHAPGALHAHAHRFERRILMSNNWAVRKSFLRDQFGPVQARLFLSDHGHAHRTLLRRFGLSTDPRPLAEFGKELAVASVRRVEECHSLHFLHPATLTQVFFASKQGTTLERRYEELVLDSTPELPAALGWARHHVDRYQSLIARVALGRASAGT